MPDKVDERLALIRQLTATTFDPRPKAVVRQVHVRESKPPSATVPSSGVDAVGFVVTVPVESKHMAPAETRTPVELVRMLVKSVGGPERAASRLRVVIEMGVRVRATGDTTTELMNNDAVVLLGG